MTDKQKLLSDGALVELKEGDCIILNLTEFMPLKEVDQARMEIERAVPGIKVIITNHMDMKILRVTQ